MEFLVTALFLLAAAGLFRDGDSRRDLSAGLLWFVAGYCGGHGTLQLCNGDHRPRTDAVRLSLNARRYACRDDHLTQGGHSRKMCVPSTPWRTLRVSTTTGERRATSA